MDDPKPSEKKYNTQELLSLNMDRLKDYMARLSKKAEDTSNPPMFEVPSPPKAKSGTRIGKVPSSCRVLALYEDPHEFVGLVSANDQRPKSQRYGLDRTADFGDAVARMTRHRYDILVASTMHAEIEEVEEPFTTLDWVFLLRGKMHSPDVYFLAKKRWFVMNLIGGETNQEKVDNFRDLKEAYGNVPLLYLQERPDEREKTLLESMRKVRVIPFRTGGVSALFQHLDALTFA